MMGPPPPFPIPTFNGRIIPLLFGIQSKGLAIHVRDSRSRSAGILREISS
ncbi:hypothetical protein C5167_020860 [Papaver somniferum]|uniref:Uncharacterized protein n=1 Tax=Papaver somniferum TaxID=3469 RepID=A0A4Y7IYD7_PAPSO|nr:hypothetical protein C5167_020860 [Papaver somniferum]